MSNEKDRTTSAAADNSAENHTANHDKSKRKALKTVAGSTMAAGAILSHKQWVEPVINTVVLPAHAQMSEDMEDDDTTGGAVTIELACSEVTSRVEFGGAGNDPLDVQFFISYTISATLLTGPADTDLSNIPLEITTTPSPLLRTVTPGSITNPAVTINPMTDANGEFSNTDFSGGLFYAASNFNGTGGVSGCGNNCPVDIQITLSFSSTDPRVTSVGPACSCVKTKSDVGLMCS